MKKIKIGFYSTVVCMASLFVLPGCNNSNDKPADATGAKAKDIPVTTASKEAMASFQEGLLSFDLGDLKKAKAAFTKAIELDPKLGIAYLYRANTSNSAKEFADDVNAGKSHLDSASDWEKMYGDYQAAGLTGDRNKQLETLEKIAANYADAARVQADLSFAYTGNNQLGKSREHAQKATELDPKWPGGFNALAVSYLFSDPKDFKKAEENAMKVVELAPKSAGAQILLGDCYRAQNDMQKAKDAYAKAVTLDPESPDAYSKEGNANTYLGNMDEARKNYLDGSAHADVKTTYLVTTAYTYLYANGDYKTALKTLMDGLGKVDAASKTATQEKSGLLTTAAAIAFHYNDAATLKQVVPMIKPLAEQMGNDNGTAEGKAFAKADGASWQAMTAIVDGKFDEAKAKAEEMKTALDPIKDGRKLENYHFLLGMISMKQKSYADAVKHFEETDLNNQIYNKYWLAMANEAAGNKDKAMSLYKEVAAYNFNDVGNAMVRLEAKKKIATP